MKSIKVIAALAALVGGSVYAGDKCPVVDACTVPFTGSVSVGYESDYIFRGLTFGEHAPWASVAINVPLATDVSLDLGTWYLNSTRGPVNFDELDTFAFLNFPLGPFKAAIGGTWYYYPELDTDNSEVAAKLAYDVGTLFTLTGFGAYDFVGEGWYLELAANKVIPLAKCWDLGLTGGVSYVSDYFGFDSWNNAFVRASLIYHLTQTTSLTAYVGGDFPLDAIEAIQDDTLHGGVSLTVTF